jgi:hypothetical protein
MTISFSNYINKLLSVTFCMEMTRTPNSFEKKVGLPSASRSLAADPVPRCRRIWQEPKTRVVCCEQRLEVFSVQPIRPKIPILSRAVVAPTCVWVPQHLIVETADMGHAVE